MITNCFMIENKHINLTLTETYGHLTQHIYNKNLVQTKTLWLNPKLNLCCQQLNKASTCVTIIIDYCWNINSNTLDSLAALVICELPWLPWWPNITDFEGLRFYWDISSQTLLALFNLYPKSFSKLTSPVLDYVAMRGF